MEAFLAYVSRCDTLTEPHQVALFTAGLGEPLKTDVELNQPATLEDAMGLARAYERRNTKSHDPASSEATSVVFSCPHTPVTTVSAIVTTPGAPTKPNGGRFQRLS